MSKKNMARHQFKQLWHLAPDQVIWYKHRWYKFWTANRIFKI